MNTISNFCQLPPYVSVKNILNKHRPTLALTFSKVLGLMSEKHIRNTSWRKQKRCTSCQVLKRSIEHCVLYFGDIVSKTRL